MSLFLLFNLRNLLYLIPIFTQFLVVTKWLTGQKEAKMRAKWLPNRITEGCFSALKMEILSPSQKVIFVWWV